jgi:hypothetical protein
MSKGEAERKALRKRYTYRLAPELAPGLMIMKLSNHETTKGRKHENDRWCPTSNAT